MRNYWKEYQEVSAKKHGCRIGRKYPRRSKVAFLVDKNHVKYWWHRPGAARDPDAKSEKDDGSLGVNWKGEPI